MCKNSISKMKSDSAIGQHLITNPECAKTYGCCCCVVVDQTRFSFERVKLYINQKSKVKWKKIFKKILKAIDRVKEKRHGQYLNNIADICTLGPQHKKFAEKHL